jgi:tight adherence protein B
VFDISNRDLAYTLGLSLVFICAYLSMSFLYSNVIAPMRYRRSLRQRVEKVTRGEALHPEIIKVMESKAHLTLKAIEKVGGRARVEDLQRQLKQADLDWDPATFLGLVVLLFLVGLIIGHLKHNILVGLGVGAVFGLLPFLYLRMKKHHKAARIEEQMPDVMDLLARSLRAGHTLPSALELASQETPHPMGTELGMVYEEQRLGIGISGALQDMTQRVDSHDLRYFVTGVLIQSETGGSLAELMEKLGHLIRERLTLKMKVQALTAEGRASAYMLGALPILLFLFLYSTQPKYVMVLLEDPTGKKMFWGAVISMIFGWFVIKRIIRIDV